MPGTRADSGHRRQRRHTSDRPGRESILNKNKPKEKNKRDFLIERFTKEDETETRLIAHQSLIEESHAVAEALVSSTTKLRLLSALQLSAVALFWPELLAHGFGGERPSVGDSSRAAGGQQGVVAGFALRGFAAFVVLTVTGLVCSRLVRPSGPVTCSVVVTILSRLALTNVVMPHGDPKASVMGLKPEHPGAQVIQLVIGSALVTTCANLLLYWLVVLYMYRDTYWSQGDVQVGLVEWWSSQAPGGRLLWVARDDKKNQVAGTLGLAVEEKSGVGSLSRAGMLKPYRRRGDVAGSPLASLLRRVVQLAPDLGLRELRVRFLSTAAEAGGDKSKNGRKHISDEQVFKNFGFLKSEETQILLGLGSYAWYRFEVVSGNGKGRNVVETQ